MIIDKWAFYPIVGFVPTTGRFRFCFLWEKLSPCLTGRFPPRQSSLQRHLSFLRLMVHCVRDGRINNWLDSQGNQTKNECVQFWLSTDLFPHLFSMSVSSILWLFYPYRKYHCIHHHLITLTYIHTRYGCTTNVVGIFQIYLFHVFIGSYRSGSMIFSIVPGVFILPRPW